jgi:hypothetical protein
MPDRSGNASGVYARQFGQSAFAQAPIPVPASFGDLARSPKSIPGVSSLERCGTVVAMLIFAPNATGLGHFEDYARKMYPHYKHLNVPTWIIGPALGEGPLIERPADVLKVWPAREPIQRLPPAQFNSLLDQFVTRHCH